ncbi:24172_t:CDS:2 [Gigaspora margarita]|uniref:24172_t:CDS:1 n=1 Tax=Gigaspora margarita TaxID=4874 RepID=A0ABM8W6N5_GIGMA|nr:24172_t:CDS:2 [Gigaspora margarita]
MFSQNRFKKNKNNKPHSYLNIHSNKTYLNDYTFSNNLNDALYSNSNNDSPYHQDYGDYSNQHTINDSLNNIDNLESDWEFEDNLSYSNSDNSNNDNIDSYNNTHDNEFNNNINSYSLDEECELTNNISKIFDKMKPDINWNNDCPFGPFENFTNTAFFIWATKYMISTAAYRDLIQILLHPQFKREHLTTNLQCLKKQREQLPLMKIYSHMILINPKNTPSTSKDSTHVYYYSLIEHIQCILKNLSISPYLYFGLSIVSKSCQELWKGDLWAESPLFGQPN